MRSIKLRSFSGRFGAYLKAFLVSLALMGGAMDFAQGNQCRAGFSESSLVRFVNLMVERRVLTDRDLDAILNSKTPLNPFEAKDSDPATVNYRRFFNSELQKIGHWDDFKEAIRGKKKSLEESFYRERNSQEATKKLFDPKFLLRIPKQGTGEFFSSPIHFQDRHIIISQTQDGWARYDITDPKNPTQENLPMGEFKALESARAEAVIDAGGRLIHIAVNTYGLTKVTDWTDAKNPVTTKMNLPVNVYDRLKLVFRDGVIHFFAANDNDQTVHVRLRPGSSVPEFNSTKAGGTVRAYADFVEWKDQFVTVEKTRSKIRVNFWNTDGTHNSTDIDLPRGENPLENVVPFSADGKLVILATPGNGNLYRWEIVDGVVSEPKRGAVRNGMGILPIDGSGRVAYVTSGNWREVSLVDWTEGDYPKVVPLPSEVDLVGAPAATIVDGQCYVVNATKYTGFRVWNPIINNLDPGLSWQHKYDSPGLGIFVETPLNRPVIYSLGKSGSIFITGSSGYETQDIIEVLH